MPALRPPSDLPLARAVRVWILLHRRWLAALCAALCVGAVLRVVAPGPAPGTAVSVAARDLSAGQVLTRADLKRAVLPAGVAPSGVEHAPLGRALTGPMRAGEVVTDARVLSPGLSEHLGGLAGVPVRIADLDVVRLLRVGDRVDVVAVDPRGAGHRPVARGGLVVALPRGGDAASHAASGAAPGALVVLGVPEGAADDLAAAAADESLHVVFRRPRP